VKEPAEQNKTDADVKSILAEAHKTFDAAAAKLNDAFNNVLSEADKDESNYKDEVAIARRWMRCGSRRTTGSRGRRITIGT
jgi:hypothetical protein